MSPKEVNASLTLSDFMASQRVKTSSSALFHVQDPVDGLWGVFSTSRGLFLPCISTEQAKEARYGFWLITTKGPKYHLLDPGTSKGTSPSFCIPHQVDEQYVIISSGLKSHLIDLINMRVYGGAEKSYLEIQHPGFEGMAVEIPDTRNNFSVLCTHGLFILVTYHSNGYADNPFIMDLKTGEILQTEKLG